MLQRILFEVLYLLRRTPWDTHKTPPELLSYLESHPPGTVLEIGCGTGTNAVTMARKGWDVTAVDFSQLAIAQAKRKSDAASRSIRFLQQDVTRLKNIPGPFDLILDIGCYHSLTEGSRKLYLKQIQDLLALGGSFLLYTHLRETVVPDETIPTIDALRQGLAQCCCLDHVEFGTDRGGRTPSAWLTFMRRPA